MSKLKSGHFQESKILMETINQNKNEEMKLTEKFQSQKAECIRVIECFYETTKQKYDLNSQMN